MVGKANLPLQSNEFKEQRALAFNEHETRMLGFEPGTLRIFRVDQIPIRDWSGRKDLNLQPPGPEPGKPIT